MPAVSCYTDIMTRTLIGNDWDEIIRDELAKPYYLQLREFLRLEYGSRKIYPCMYEIFNALKHTPYSGVRVVILGQDPYINEGEAHGLAFSVKHGAKVPPSLKNIFKECNDDVGATPPNHGCLVDWTRQGVLLLNTCLTVRAGCSKSHSGRGWENFTTFIIEKLNNRTQPTVFMLWGRDAQSKQELVTNPIHKVLVAAHPSPLAGGRFFGCKHFSRANTFLRENGVQEIDWQITNAD